MKRPDTARELAAIREQLTRIEKCLHDAFATLPKLPDDAKAAAEARAAARARGFYWAREFSFVVGRAPQWVTDRCASKVIKTLPGGKPFRIPLSEESRWTEAEAE